MNRAVAVMRMHLVDRVTLFVLPSSILAAAFVINLLIWTVEPVDARTTGAASSVYVFVMAAAGLAVARGLPFALGMGSSRRAFTIGTGMTGGVLALVMGTAYLALNRIEVASHGWWLHGAFFELPWFKGANPAILWLAFVVAFLAVFMVGAAIAAVWVRWNNRALVLGLPALVLLLGAAAVLLTWGHGWEGMWRWIADLTPLALTGWLTLASVAFGAATWAVLRRVRVG